jgi:hypothetical protein
LNPVVIFIWDATEYVRIDVEKILTGLSETIRKTGYENKDNAIKYQYGAAVFHDDGSPVEMKDNLTGNVSDLISWNRSHLDYNGKNSNNTGHFKAVFNGIQEALNWYDRQADYFNPRFIVMIDDCSNNYNSNTIIKTYPNLTDSLKSHISDMATIQFKTRMFPMNYDKNRSGEIFTNWYKDVLAAYGNSEISTSENFTLEKSISHPGSFLAYTNGDKTVTAENLRSILEYALTNYNATIREKLVHLVRMLQDRSGSGVLAKEELKKLTHKYVNQNNLNVTEIDQIIEWVKVYLTDFASNIQVTSGNRIEIQSSYFKYFEIGYALKKCYCLDHQPFKKVLFLTNKDLNIISDFAGNTARLTGSSTRINIKKSFYHMLINVLKLYQSIEQVDQLGMSEALSLITGFKGYSKYDQIRIKEITSMSEFPDELMLEYLFECCITTGYLRSIRNGTWQLTPVYLKSFEPLMRTLLRKKGLNENITPVQLQKLSDKLTRKDCRNVAGYFKNYPCFNLDPFNKIKAYWVETEIFAHGDNEFVNLLITSSQDH